MNKELPIHTVFLSLGSNLGDRFLHLQSAIRHIANRLGEVAARSSVLETEPWGFESQQAFLNMAIKVNTRLSPMQVLYITQAIEREMGRTEKTQGAYKDRIIDIDIIFYDQLEIKTPQLTLPHPLYKERDFVMKPLAELMDSDTLSKR